MRGFFAILALVVSVVTTLIAGALLLRIGTAAGRTAHR